MNNSSINTFNFGVNPVRIYLHDGVPWWVAMDVCAAIGIDKHRDAISRLEEDERGSVEVDTLGGRQEVGAVNEAGLYTLILRSRKPEAKAFKRWITHEVIPSIRKTGSYSVASPFKVPQSLAEALRMALEVEEERAALACRVEALEPKAAALDRIATRAKGSLTLMEAAKLLQQPPHKFVSRLHAEGWIFRQNGRNVAYQTKVQQQLMEHKFSTVQHVSGPEDVAQPLITPKGIVKLAEILQVNGLFPGQV